MADVLSRPSEKPMAQSPASWRRPVFAARALYLAAATFLASMVAISLFFGGAGAFWGPVNDLLVAATVLLLLPPIAVVHDLASGRPGRWFSLVTMAAAAGVLLVAAGQLALVAGLITLESAFVSGGLGVLPVIAWVGATGALSLRTELLGQAVGAWAIAFLLLIGITVVVLATVTSDTPTLTALLGGPLLVVLLGWMVSLARALSRR